MKNIGLMVLALVFGLGVLAGCAEKEETSEKPKEAAQPAESVAEKPAEAPPAQPEAATEKAVEEKAPVAAVEKAVKKTEEAAKDVVAGTVIFRTKCVPCHGADGVGTAMAPAFKGNAWIKGASRDDIAAVIKNGREGAAKKYKKFVISMPAQKGMSDSDVNALVDYLKSIN